MYEVFGFGFRLCSFLSRCVGYALLQAPEEALNPRPVTKQKAALKAAICLVAGQDLNLRPSGYEPDELPGCSTPRYYFTAERAACATLFVRHGP